MVRLQRGLGTPVRIAFVHSFYRSENPSGENAVVQAEVVALRRAGYEAELFAVSTDDLKDEPLYRLRTAARVASRRGRNPLDAIRRFEPDIVHVHNLFPNYGSEWVRDLDVPLIVTLHNYRPLCAKATLFRDGHICTLCPDGARWAGVRFACYQDSRLATLPLAWANRDGAGADAVLARADAIVALSDRMRDLYVSDGVDATKVRVSPNFLPEGLDPGQPGGRPQPNAPWLFVGRLDEAKGIVPLLEAWPRTSHLKVVGDGPFRSIVESTIAGRGEIDFLGPASRAGVIELMRASIGLVFPSRWYEGFPLTYVEALACNLPVLAFPPNVVAEEVKHSDIGHTVRWNGDLERHLAEQAQRFASLGEKARKAFERRFSERAYLERVTAIYEGLL